MNAKKRVQKLSAVKAPSAAEVRRYNARWASSPRELAKFKKFVLSNLRRLERGESTLMVVTVVTDPDGPSGLVWSRAVGGPPWAGVPDA
jgi:hypothetical protein